jgi:hypothetical protein
MSGLGGKENNVYTSPRGTNSTNKTGGFSAQNPPIINIGHH